MEDIAISIASKIAEYLVKPLLQHAHYMFSFNKIVRNLHNHKDRLILTQRSVNERKKEAKRKTEKIEDIVEKWMDDVSNVLVEVEKIEEKTKEKSRCYRGPFQYLLAKEVARLTEKMSKLNSYKLDPFSRRTELPGMKYFSSKNFVYSKSTKDAYNKLMEALKDGSNGMIGLLGMGGAVTNIQGQIADSLDLILREETPIGRAQRLSTSLQNERTLVILDDVWEKLNLEAIGIPPCCTVLLTTRRRDICCPKLKTLLLHSVDGSSFQVPNMYFGGMQMLEVLGIIKFYYTWRNLYTLRNLSSSLSMLKIHQSIEKLTMLRSLSLRGYELGDISALASLTRLEVLDMRNSSFNELPQGIGALKKLRLLDIYTCRIKKNNPYEVIRKCVHLEELYAWPVEDDSFHIVSLPMLHRYVIVCDKFRENCRFLIDAYLEDHVPSRALCIDRYDAAALIHESSSIKNLFERAEHLYLGHLRGGCKNIIPHMDQGGMTKVIGLILESCSDIECLLDNDSGTNLPAFSDLVTLKLIRMDGLKEVFRDPTSQCSLKNLEDLQIEYCVQLNSISFPRNSNMCNLKILRLQWCPMLTSSLFTPAVARGLELLEELKLFDCSNLKHIIDEEYEEDGNASTLKVFPNLRILHVHGCQRLGSIFPVAFAQNLERLEKIAIWYNFGLKYVFGTHNDYKGNGNEAKANVNLHALRRISLVSLSNMINICPKYFQALECLAIEHSMVEGIFQLQAAEASPLSSNLSHLYLKDLPDLRLIWKCPKDLLSLRKLKSLVLSECKNLETIFSSTIIGCLAELRELVASKCEKLEQIIYSDLAEQVGNASACSNSVCLPLLSVVHVFQCKNLKCLFSHSLASPFPELEFITVEECASIEHVFYFTEDDRGQEVGQVPDQDRQQLLLPKLRELKLICLPNFTEICQGPYKLQKNVKHYTVRHCPKYTDAWLQTENQVLIHCIPYNLIMLVTKFIIL
uniref:Disease resistance protein At1g61180 family n=1 Tax=Cajanus cajan TaxID=3821 RepID=A0A151SE17_CAJCA|nr:putative disease resistance protein At1g61180 family [Cajanus cajan]